MRRPPSAIRVCAAVFAAGAVGCEGRWDWWKSEQQNDAVEQDSAQLASRSARPEASPVASSSPRRAHAVGALRPEEPRPADATAGASRSSPGPSVETATARPRPARLSPGRSSVTARMLVVNHDVITVEDILTPIMAELERMLKEVSPQQYVRQMERKVGTRIWQEINLLLVYQQAARELLDEQNEAIDRAVDDQIKARINEEFGGVESRFEKYLAEVGQSMERERERIRRELVAMGFLRDRIESKLDKPRRPELEAYYKAHESEYSRPARAELFLIEVAVSGFLGKLTNEASPAELAEAKGKARKRIERAAQELRSGVDFAAVAKTYSVGLHAKEGGAWGMITEPGLRGRWAEPARKLFTLQEGQTSEIVETPEAFFIVKAGKVVPAVHVSFAEAQPAIIEALRNKQYEQLKKEYLLDLILRAKIERREEFQEAVLRAVPMPPGTAEGLTRSRL